MNKPDAWRSKDDTQVHIQAALEAAHKETFKKVCDVVNDLIIEPQKFIRLTKLHDLCISYLQETPFPNPNFWGENWKNKLEKCEQYRRILGFCPTGKDGKFKSYLVFSSETDICEAIKASYHLGQSDKVKEVAFLLQDEVQSAFKERDEIPWPYTASDLSGQDVFSLPKQLSKFLSYLLSEEKTPSKKILRLANSIGRLRRANGSHQNTSLLAWHCVIFFEVLNSYNLLIG